MGKSKDLYFFVHITLKQHEKSVQSKLHIFFIISFDDFFC